MFLLRFPVVIIFPELVTVTFIGIVTLETYTPDLIPPSLILLTKSKVLMLNLDTL